MAISLKDKKILVTGGHGFLGTPLVRNLIERRGVPGENIFIPTAAEYNLLDRENCEKVVLGRDIIIHLAAMVGGIGLNMERPGELFYRNIIMGTQMMEAARLAGAEKFVGLGTICAYPKFTPVPFREEDLWNGYPEETNAPYGLAKKMLLVQAQAYRKQYGMNAIVLFPVNMYGPGDNFDPKSSHVMAALIREIIDAKEKNVAYIEAWGTGNATREFLYVEDAAEGILLATERYDKSDPVNLGSGGEISIKDLAKLLASLIGYKGDIRWDTSRPDGQPRRSLDGSRAEKEFGFRAKVKLEEGLRNTIEWYRNRRD